MESKMEMIMKRKAERVKLGNGMRKEIEMVDIHQESGRDLGQDHLLADISFRVRVPFPWSFR